MSDQDPNSIKQNLAASIQGMQDYNNLLKDSLKFTKNLENLYSRIDAKISSLNKSAINTKKIEQETIKLTEKAFNAQKNELDLEKNLTIEAKRYTDYVKQKNLNYKEAFTYLVKTNNVEALNYTIAKELTKITKEKAESGKEILETEKEVEKLVGSTGKLLEFTNKYLGIGGGLYKKIVEEARDGSVKTKALVISSVALGVALKKASEYGAKVFSGLSNAASAINPDSSNNISKLTSGVSGLLKTIPLIGPLAGSLVDSFSSIADLLIGIDDSIIKTGRALNLNSVEARKLNDYYKELAVNSGDIFYNSKRLAESQVELTNLLGVTNKFSDESLETNIKLKDIAGLEEDSRKSILESSILTAKSSQSITDSILAQVIGLQKATGISIPFKEAIKEASNLGGYLGLSFSKYPDKISKSVLVAKSFGLELKQLDSIADSFLDFESSISKEFEAQLLTGKDINLNKARELAMNNDLAGVAAEISKQVGSSADFLEMNRFKANALAAAFGMSRDSLADMMKKSEVLTAIGAKQTDSSKKQLELAKQRYGTETAIIAAIGDPAYQTLVNGSTQERTTAIISKLQQTALDFIEKSHLVDKITNLLDYISNPQNMNSIINTIKGIISGAIGFFTTVTSALADMVSHMPFTDKQMWQSIADQVRSAGVSGVSSINSFNSGGSASISDMKISSTKNNGSTSSSTPMIMSSEAPNVKVDVYMDPITGVAVYKVVNQSNGMHFDNQTGTLGKTKN